jgi:hypothetical protein
LFCQNNTKLARKVPIFYQIGIVLAKQYEIGKKGEATEKVGN